MQESSPPWEIRPTDLFSEEAMELFVSHFKTPLQIVHYAERALDEACKAGSKQVDRGIVQEILPSELYPRKL